MNGALAGTRHRLGVGVVGVAGLVVLAQLSGCGVSKDEEPPAATRPVTPRPTPTTSDTSSVLIGESHGAPAQLGHAAVRISVVTTDGGKLSTGKGPDGLRALAFPGFVAGGAYPRAVVTVENTGSNDALNPGEGAFTWGADFRLDVRSAGRSEDNGDNLVQRGLYSESTEYKAELDLDRPACTVHGDEGIVTIRGNAIVPGIWYHMECRRRGYELTVSSWALDQPSVRSQRTGYGPMGDLTPQSPDVPLAVGGKVGPDGTIVRSDTDQFNGDIAHAFLRIAGAG